MLFLMKERILSWRSVKGSVMAEATLLNGCALVKFSARQRAASRHELEDSERWSGCQVEGLGAAKGDGLSVEDPRRPDAQPDPVPCIEVCGRRRSPAVRPEEQDAGCPVVADVQVGAGRDQERDGSGARTRDGLPHAPVERPELRPPCGVARPARAGVEL